MTRGTEQCFPTPSPYLSSLRNACLLAMNEAVRADSIHGHSFASMHEGWAVLKEEVDELWEAVRLKQGPERSAAVAKEAVQVAAMALRFLANFHPEVAP